MQKGKFIVIDGTDGSGKTTQLNILVKRLRENGLSIKIADFPQYNQKSAGLVEEYLGGKYGNADEVGPYAASIFYAIDRYDGSFKIRKWINEGHIVISNRYVTANMGHQGAKFSSSGERAEYFNWLHDLEYSIFGIPKPDLNVILHVSSEISQMLSKKRDREDWKDKKRDIHEEDLNHLRKAEKVYLEIADQYPDIEIINCSHYNEILPIEEIHKMLWSKIIKSLNIHNKFLNNINYTSLKTKKVSKSDNSKIKVEKINHSAKIPTRAHATDAGMDLYANDYYSLVPGEKANIHTGIKMSIPDGYVGLIWDKSGIANEGMHTVAGVIDSGYRGEVLVSIINLGYDLYHIAPGQKIAQMLIQKIECPEISEEIIEENTERGKDGFGSTGLY